MEPHIMNEIRIKPVNLDQFCITQAQYDDENACEEIKRLHNSSTFNDPTQLWDINTIPIYDQYLLSDECACTLTMNNVQTKVWVIKIGRYYGVLLKGQYNLRNCIKIYTDFLPNSVIISGILIGITLDLSLNDNEYVLK